MRSKARALGAALRPIEDFVAKWERTGARLAEAERPRITVLGAGAGGVEVALAVA